MKPYLFIAVAFITIFTSCAHKSGHLKDNIAESKAVTKVSAVETSNIDDTVSNSQKQINNSAKAELSGNEIFKRYNQAVFMIYTSNGNEGFQGSGFFINDSGLAVSNYHVFKGTLKGKEIVKLSSGYNYRVKNVLAKDEKCDFILFQVACENTTYIPIAKDRPEIGDKAFAIGSPQGLENTFSEGVISQWRDKNIMQISVQIDHGSSGGALINTNGEVIGITSGTFCEGSQANLNYAESIDVIKPYLK